MLFVCVICKVLSLCSNQVALLRKHCTKFPRAGKKNPQFQGTRDFPGGIQTLDMPMIEFTREYTQC